MLYDSHRQDTANVLIRRVLPALSRLLDTAGAELAQQIHEKPDIFDIEDAQQALMFGLLDFLGNCAFDHSEDYIWGICEPHHLGDTRFAAAFFDVEPRTSLLPDQRRAVDQALDADEAARAESASAETDGQ